MVDRARLESECTFHEVPRVRIPPPPLNCAKACTTKFECSSASIGRPYCVKTSIGRPYTANHQPGTVEMWYVYILKSRGHDWYYVGSTGDLKKRFREHNLEENQSTKSYAPFELDAYIAVKTEKKARELESYFKTGSGKAVLKKRILSDEASA